MIGLLVASLPAVQYGQLHYRRLEIDKNIALKLAKGNNHATMCLSPAAKADLIWWADNVLESRNPISPDCSESFRTTIIRKTCENFL